MTLRYSAALGAPGSGTPDEGRQKVIDAFNARFAPTRVVGEAGATNPDGVTKLLAQVASGTPPDVVNGHPREYHPLVNNGALLELDRYMARDREVMPDLIPAAVDYWLRDGKRYAMPGTWTPHFLYFNRALFDQRGLKAPDQHEREGTWTFDTYLDLARKLTATSGDQKTYGTAWSATALDIQLSYIWPFGGELWDKAVQTTLLDSKEALEAIQFLGDLTARFEVAPKTDEAAQFPGGVLSGRVGMEIKAIDDAGPFNALDFDKGMAPNPKGRAGRRVRGVAMGAHLLKGSTHPDAAWEFAHFSSTLAAERIMLELRASVPFHKSTLASPEYPRLLRPWESAAFFIETANHMPATVYPARFREIANLYAPAFEAVRRGQKTAATAIAEIKPQINDLLRQS